VTLLRSRTLALALGLALGVSAPQASDNRKAGQFYEDALKRVQARDLDGATIQLKNALQADPKMLAAHLLLGKVALDNANPGAAEAALSEALQLGASPTEVVVPLAQALLMQGKQPSMLVDERLQPGGLPPAVQAELLLARAAAQSDLGETRAALASIEGARRLAPQRPESWLVEVPLRIRTQALPEALKAAEQALRLAPQSPEALYLRATVLHAQGQLAAALSGYGQVLTQDPSHLEALVAHAGLALDLEQVDAARATLASLLRQHPRDPRGAYLRALVAERDGQRTEALTALRSVVDLIDPVPIDRIRFRPQLLLLAAMSHHALEQPDKAKPYLELIVRQQPKSPAVKLLAQILFDQGQTENGIQVLESFLRVQPQDAQALAMLAMGHSAAGRHGKAMALTQQALGARDDADLRGALGLALLRSGQVGNAREQLEAAYQRDPRNPRHAQALAMLYLRQGQGKLAVPVAQSWAQAQPTQPSAQHVLGAALAAAGDAKGARAAFERALQLEPNALEPQVSLARLDAQAGQWDAAERRLLSLSERHENAVDPLLELARVALQRGKLDDAARWLERAAGVAPQRDVRASFALVDVLLQKGDAARALAAANTLVARVPEDPAALQAQALAHLAAGDPKSARQPLANASRRQQADAALLTDIANLQLRADDLPGATYTLEKALQAQRDHPPALLLMASLELRSGQIDKAEARWRQLLAIRSRSAATHHLAADIAMARRQPAQALEALRKAHAVQPSTATVMRLFIHQVQHGASPAAIVLAEGWLTKRPQDTAVRQALANQQAATGQWAAARLSYDQLLKQQPRNADAWNNLANVHLALKDAKAASLAAERALAARPGFALALDTLGWALHLQGQHDKALSLLRDARLRAPDNGEIRYHLAAVLAQTGRRAEAKTEIEAALAQPSSLESTPAARALANTLK
jgi:putative PEP-CTERM system TPR-repeat lipoprotein